MLLSRGAIESGIPSALLRMVLICDDAPLGLSATEEGVLRGSTACRIERTSSAEELLSFLDRRRGYVGRATGNPSLILIDYTTGVEKGDDLIRSIRRNQELRNVPIVVFTAQEGEDVVETAWDAGADGFLEVPFDQDAYYVAVDRTTRYWLNSSTASHFRRLSDQG